MGGGWPRIESQVDPTNHQRKAGESLHHQERIEGTTVAPGSRWALGSDRPPLISCPLIKVGQSVFDSRDQRRLAGSPSFSIM